MKKFYSILMILLLLITGVTGCGAADNSYSSNSSINVIPGTGNPGSQATGKDSSAPASGNDSSSGDTGNTDNKTTGNYNIEIKIKDYGTIEAELYADKAPVTVDNFIKLVNDGFYNNLTFHRIMKGFMIQGGDPEGTGMGGSDTTIKGEFSANGIENDISHVRGVLSMARSSGYDSASSQFFIVHEDSTFLDGKYAGFGMVTKGMEVVDKICEDAEPTDNNGTISADKQPVIESIKVK